MKVRRTFGFIGIVALLAGTSAVRGAAVSNAFTYQGELLDNGTAVDGMTEFQFTLWDDGVAGTQRAVLPPEMIDVVKGRFTATVDFGATAFSGDARWLEISVKPPGATAFTVLSRQELTPSPAALTMPGFKTEQTLTETVLSIGTTTPVKLMRDNATGDLKVAAGTSSMTLNSADGLACFGDGLCAPPALSAEAAGLEASEVFFSPMIFDPANRTIQLAPGRIVKIDPVTDDVVVTGDLLTEGGVTAKGNVDAVAEVVVPAGAGPASVITTGIRLNALTQRIEPIDPATPIDVNPTGQTMLGETIVGENFQAKKMAKFGQNSLEIDGDAVTIRPTDPTATLFLDAGTVCLGSSCCVSNPTATGCQDLACETAVCAASPTCCSVAWDPACAGIALQLCPTLCVPKDIDVTGDQSVAGNTVVGGSGSFAGAVSIGSSGVAAGAGAAAEQLVGSITIDGETISSSTGQVDFTNDKLVNIQKVGIGTPNPSFALDARGTVFQLKTTGGFGPSLQLVGDDTADVTIKLCNVPSSGCNSIFDDDADAHALKIEANEFAVNIATMGEAFRIDSAKNVGIGTNAPLARMHVQELDLSVSSTALSLDDLVVESGDAVLGLYSNSSGAFGSTLVLAEVNGTGTIADKWAMTRNDTGAGSRLMFKYGPNPAYAANPTIMALEPGGDVGIGTGNPSNKLHVVASSTNSAIWAQNSGQGFAGVFQNTNTAGVGTALDVTHRNASADVITARSGTAGSVVFRARADGSFFNRVANDGVILYLQRSGSVKGTITVSGNTVSYNAFTGSHYGWTQESLTRGTLVVMTGENRSLQADDTAEPIYGVAASSTSNDPRCLGAYLGIQEPHEPASLENPHQIMAVGNGDMWVSDSGRDIQPGDYLISSDVSGHAMLDDAERFSVGYVIARAAEPVDWSKVNESIDGKKHKKISVFFESFVRGSRAVADMQRELKELRGGLAAQTARLTGLEARMAALEGVSDDLHASVMGGAR